MNKNPYRVLSEHYPKEHLKREAKGNFAKKDCFIYSYEDYTPEQISDPKFEKKRDIYFGKSAKRYDLVVIRDPFNLLASRFKNQNLKRRFPNDMFSDLWIAYAQEYLGETNYLKNKVVVNYNNWFRDKEYRKQLASQLNIEFSDAGINEVKVQGGGSSFDGLQFHGQATNMDILNRWKHFSENPEFRKLLNNKKLIEYSERIFGYIEGTESLLEK
ncbi:MAG TPA: hypothetical protein DD379_02125 [Cyanobacteria bacterium UBA11162]|nr:hypothetical protein [Cyanobacteria bacterium UBA11162]